MEYMYETQLTRLKNVLTTSFVCGIMKFISIENVCAACHIENAWQLVVRLIFSKTKKDIRLHSEIQA
jgi:hypothetical protein